MVALCSTKHLPQGPNDGDRGHVPLSPVEVVEISQIVPSLAPLSPPEDFPGGNGTVSKNRPTSAVAGTVKPVRQSMPSSGAFLSW